MSQDRIGFFYPTRNVGGAQYLFARMAQYLIDHTSYEVVLIDYRDGFIRSRLAGKNYHFIEYKDQQVITIPEPLLLVLSLSYLSLIPKYFVLPQTTKLFFWDLHPYNLVEQLALSGLYKRLHPTLAHLVCSLLERTRCKKLACFVEQGVARCGLAFMAERNRHYNQQLLGFSAQAEYLPIPIEPTNMAVGQRSISRRKITSTIHVGWLSRLDSWKVTVLFRLLDDVRAYERINGSNSIHLHIIGDGAEWESVRSRSMRDNVTMVGRLEGNALTEYMLTNLHVGFAMGTSALEFAVRGIPTVLVPGRVSVRDLLREKVYRWLFDSQGYDVASEQSRRPESLISFFEAIRLVQTFGLEHLGDRCKDYVSKNHLVDNVGALFAKYLSNCSLTYEDISRLGIYELSPKERSLFALKWLLKSGHGKS